MEKKRNPRFNNHSMEFSFEIYTLDVNTLCHDKELYISDTFSTYDEAMERGMEKLKQISFENGNELVELNVWSVEKSSYVTEITYKNGKENNEVPSI